MKKLCTLFLALVIAMSITVTPAFASATGGSDLDTPVPTSATTKVEIWSIPDYASGLETVVQPYGSNFLYWAMMVLDPQPQLVYDYEMHSCYLSYQLSASSKLSGLLTTYGDAFRLQHYLDTLIEENDVNTAIWAKPDWREKSIGEQLSNATAAKLKSGNYNAYEALQIVKQSDEYLNAPDTLPNLREQVDYHLAVLRSCRSYVIHGLQQLKLAYIDLYDFELTPETEPTVSGVIKTAQKQLEEHPELACLNEVYKIYLSGTTSNSIATFQSIDAEKCDELWAGVSEIAEVRWPQEYNLLETARFAVPFTVAQYNGSVVIPTVPGHDSLPTSATGN